MFINSYWSWMFNSYWFLEMFINSCYYECLLCLLSLLFTTLFIFCSQCKIRTCFIVPRNHVFKEVHCGYNVWIFTASQWAEVYLKKTSDWVYIKNWTHTCSTDVWNVCVYFVCIFSSSCFFFFQNTFPSHSSCVKYKPQIFNWSTSTTWYSNPGFE